MDNRERIRMLPHHIDILASEKEDNYQGWERHMNYMYAEYYPKVFPGAYCLSKESVSRMADFFRKLSQSPNIEVEVIERNQQDSVCGLCDNMVNGNCKYEGGDSSDKKAQLKYNLSVGEVRTVSELLVENQDDS